MGAVHKGGNPCIPNDPVERRLRNLDAAAHHKTIPRRAGLIRASLGTRNHCSGGVSGSVVRVPRAASTGQFTGASSALARDGRRYNRHRLAWNERSDRTEWARARNVPAT